MTSCPICCGEARPSYRATDENHRVSATEFHYATCSACATVFLTNPPADLGRYYEADYYAIPTLDRLAAIGRRDRTKLAAVTRFAKGKRLLEIGAAFGVFAYQAKQAGFEVEAIEMDERCCAYLRETVGIRAIQSDTPHQAIACTGPHDVIALWHVLEHLPDARALVEAAAANLAPGGILVVAMPNPAAAQFALMGAHWPHLDAPRHLTLIPAAALEQLGRAHGLEPVHLTSDDGDAHHWNAFGWQRLLMNRVRPKLLKQAMLVAGTALGLAAIPFDRRAMRGSAYTMVLRKAG